MKAETLMEAIEIKAISEAREIFADHGIDFATPWDCDLDDRERERFHGLVYACRQYARTRWSNS